MPIASDPPAQPNDPLAGALESFARDLLALVRGVRVYPRGHEFLAQLARRLLDQLSTHLPTPLSLGVTPGALTLGEFVSGGRQRRTAELAALLHKRKVGRLTVDATASAEQLLAAAHALAAPRRTGTDLATDLSRSGVTAVTLQPLQLEKLHTAFREQARDAATRAEERALDAWHWVLDGEITPDRVAGLLAAEDTLNGLDDAAPGDEAIQLTALLFRLGGRLGEALAQLPPERAQEVRLRLAQVGKRLSPRELATLLREADAQGVLSGPLGDAVEQAFGGDKLLDLLAALVVEEGRDTRRLSAVYARLGTPAQAAELLTAVREKLATGATGTFAAEVWGAVEAFLLDLQEAPFMDSDYSATLERVAASGRLEDLWQGNLAADLESHLDAVLVGLALQTPEAWQPRALRRLEQRMSHADPAALLGLATELDRSAPALLDSHPTLTERLFSRCSRQIRTLDQTERRNLLDFARRHEPRLLGPLFRALLLEEQLPVRRFLVEAVAILSPAATPALVSRLRSSPWYVTRNLTIAMGRRREEATLPVLKALLQHEHAKVRREAILALGRFGTPAAARALAVLAGSSRTSPEERSLAARALEAAAQLREQP